MKTFRTYSAKFSLFHYELCLPAGNFITHHRHKGEVRGVVHVCRGRLVYWLPAETVKEEKLNSTPSLSLTLGKKATTSNVNNCTQNQLRMTFFRCCLQYVHVYVWYSPSRGTRASRTAFGTYSNRSAMCQRSPAKRRPALSRLRARIDCKLQVTQQ